MKRTDIIFSDFRDSGDLGFFLMDITIHGDLATYCGGSKELQNIERNVSNGVPIWKYKEYLVK